VLNDRGLVRHSVILTVQS